MQFKLACPFLQAGELVQLEGRRTHNTIEVKNKLYLLKGQLSEKFDPITLMYKLSQQT